MLEKSHFFNFLFGSVSGRKKYVDLENPTRECGAFLRAALFEPDTFDPYHYCHRPIVVTDEGLRLSEVILKIRASHSSDKSFDGAIDHDVVLVWAEQKRIITGADIFGRLLKGMVAPKLTSHATSPNEGANNQ